MYRVKFRPYECSSHGYIVSDIREALHFISEKLDLSPLCITTHEPPGKPGVIWVYPSMEAFLADEEDLGDGVVAEITPWEEPCGEDTVTPDRSLPEQTECSD